MNQIVNFRFVVLRSLTVCTMIEKILRKHSTDDINAPYNIHRRVLRIRREILQWIEDQNLVTSIIRRPVVHVRQ